MFLAPILIGDQSGLGSARHLFAATSVLVAIREELAYRAILQRALTSKYRFFPSLALSNLAFVAYHLGVGPFHLHYFVQVFLCGCILGTVYHLSGSIVWVIILHTVYDALDAYSPFPVPRLPDFACTIILSTTFTALLLVSRKTPGLQKGQAT